MRTAICYLGVELGHVVQNLYHCDVRGDGGLAVGKGKSGNPRSHCAMKDFIVRCPADDMFRVRNEFGSEYIQNCAVIGI